MSASGWRASRCIALSSSKVWRRPQHQRRLRLCHHLARRQSLRENVLPLRFKHASYRRVPLLNRRHCGCQTDTTQPLFPACLLATEHMGAACHSLDLPNGLSFLMLSSSRSKYSVAFCSSHASASVATACGHSTSVFLRFRPPTAQAPRQAGRAAPKWRTHRRDLLHLQLAVAQLGRHCAASEVRRAPPPPPTPATHQ